MTTRKDMYALADAFRQSQPEGVGAATEQWLRDVKAVADALNVTMGFTPNGNRSFDEDRFFAACGIEKEDAR